jgi:hypothetical protein
MSEFTPEEEAEIEYYKAKMRSIGLIAAAGLIEPQQEIAERHTEMADQLIEMFLTKIPKQHRRLFEAQIKNYALKISRIK